jgi:hypothetical protein
VGGGLRLDHGWGAQDRTGTKPREGRTHAGGCAGSAWLSRFGGLVSLGDGPLVNHRS